MPQYEGGASYTSVGAIVRSSYAAMHISPHQQCYVKPEITHHDIQISFVK